MNEEMKEAGREKAPDAEHILAKLLETHEAAGAEKREAGEAWVEDRIRHLPENARRDVLRTVERIKSLSPEPRDEKAEATISALVDEKVTSFEQTYLDKRFTLKDDEHILTDAYSREKTVEWIKSLLDEKPKLEDLTKIARLNFDANGLKAVNDLSGSHQNGTEYLRRIAWIFHDEDSRPRRLLKEMGIKDVIPTTSGGDEYSVLLKSDAPLDPDTLQKAVRAFEEEFENMDVSDLVDFKDLDTQLRFIGMSRKEYDALDEGGREDVRGRVAKEIPPGFKMRASCSGGAATLRDGLTRALSDPRESKRLTATDGYDRSIMKMMGGLIDEADAVAMETKAAYKEALRDSDKAGDKFYSKVLMRTTEARVLEEKLQNLNSELAKFNAFKKEMADMTKLLVEGMLTQGQFQKMMMEKLGQPGLEAAK